MNIKKAFAGAALAAGLIGGSLATAPLAAADEASYINDIENYGFYGDVGTALAVGYAACDLSAQGFYIEDITEGVYQNTAASVSYDDAAFLVESALIFLC